jgi:hypothetical protein
MKHPSDQRKTLSQLSDSTCRQLNMYALAASAAGVGALALARSAEAKIVYTPVHVTLSGLSSVYKMDLNHDGVTDFSIGKQSNSSFSTIGSLGQVFNAFNVGNEWIKVNRPGGIFPADLAAGEEVGQRQWTDGQFTSTNSYMFRMFWHRQRKSGGTLSYWSDPFIWGAWANNGKGATNRYLGLRFAIKGAYHYGWARMSVKIGPRQSTITITGYAYETVAGKKIATGDTGVAADTNHEPGTLGQLAAGRR